MLNTLLHHVGMSLIIETHEHLKYDIDKHNPYWITGGPWYNTSICKKYMIQCLNNLLEMQELADIISSVIVMQMRNSSHHLLMMLAAVVVMRYHQIQQQNH